MNLPPALPTTPAGRSGRLSVSRRAHSLAACRPGSTSRGALRVVYASRRHHDVVLRASNLPREGRIGPLALFFDESGYAADGSGSGSPVHPPRNRCRVTESDRDPAGFRPRLWYNNNVVEDVGFMVTEVPPSI